MPASDPVERFRVAARHYCELVEGAAPGQDLEGFVRQAHESLAEVFASALVLSLPSVDDNEPEVEEPTHDERMRMYGRLRELLGPADHYVEIWDSEGTDPRSMVEGSLADALADVYGDLQQGLRLDAAGSEVDAVFAWTEGFWMHWGRHAADIVRVLQLLRERKGWLW